VGPLVRTLTFVIWGILALAALALETAGRLRAGSLAPFGQAMRALRAPSVGRAALVLAWMWFGWHVFAR